MLEQDVDDEAIFKERKMDGYFFSNHIVRKKRVKKQLLERMNFMKTWDWKKKERCGRVRRRNPRFLLPYSYSWRKDNTR